MSKYKYVRAIYDDYGFGDIQHFIFIDDKEKQYDFTLIKDTNFRSSDLYEFDFESNDEYDEVRASKEYKGKTFAIYYTMERIKYFEEFDFHQTGLEYRIILRNRDFPFYGFRASSIHT